MPVRSAVTAQAVPKRSGKEQEELQNLLLNKEQELEATRAELEMEERTVDEALERLRQEHLELKQAREELELEERQVDATLERLKTEHSESKRLRLESAQDKDRIEELNRELRTTTEQIARIVRQTRKKHMMLMVAALLMLPGAYTAMLYLDGRTALARLQAIVQQGLEIGDFERAPSDKVTMTCKQLLRLQDDANAVVMERFAIGAKIRQTLAENHCPQSYAQWQDRIRMKKSHAAREQVEIPANFSAVE